VTVHLSSFMRVRHVPVPWVIALALSTLLTGCSSTGERTAAIDTAEPVATLAPTSVPATLAPSATIAIPTPTVALTSTPAPSLTPTARAFAIVVDPGHGGIDLGARRFDDQGRMVYHESTVNLELGLLTRDALLARGFQVVMTRDTDRTVNEGETDVSGDGVFEYTMDETQARVDLINASGADLILSIHHNAYQDASGAYVADVGGIQTYYCADRPFGADNLRFALLIQQHLIAAIHGYGYDIQDRGVLDDAVLETPDSPGKHLILLGPTSARIVRPSEIPGALSEPLFITHRIEGELARDPALLAALAVAEADAVEAYVSGVDPASGAP
jgi:N-acetylmuramoyl-L-alanine amidase